MEAVIEYLSQNPLYAVGAVVLLLFFVIALLKKMVKVAILAVALIAGYGYYLNDIAQDTYDKAEARYEEAKDKAEYLIDEAGELIK